MILLNVWRLAHVSVRHDVRAIEFLFVAFVDRAYIEQDVFIENGRTNQSPESEPHSYTTWMQGVVALGCGIECVAIDLQTIVHVVGFSQILFHVGAVGIGEDEAHVVDEVINGIALDAVVFL